MTATVDDRRRARPVGQDGDVVWWPGWVLDGLPRLWPGSDAAWVRRRAENRRIAAEAAAMATRRAAVAGLLKSDGYGALAGMARVLEARLLRFVVAAEGRDDAALAEAGGQVLAYVDALDLMIGEAEAAVCCTAEVRGVFCGGVRARERVALGLDAIEDGSVPPLPQATANAAAGRV